MGEETKEDDCGQFKAVECLWGELNLGGSLSVNGIGITYLSLALLDATMCILLANGLFEIDFSWSGVNLGDEMMDLKFSSSIAGKFPFPVGLYVALSLTGVDWLDFGELCEPVGLRRVGVLGKGEIKCGDR